MPQAPGPVWSRTVAVTVYRRRKGASPTTTFGPAHDSLLPGTPTERRSAMNAAAVVRTGANSQHQPRPKGNAAMCLPRTPARAGSPLGRIHAAVIPQVPTGAEPKGRQFNGPVPADVVLHMAAALRVRQPTPLFCRFAPFVAVQSGRPSSPLVRHQVPEARHPVRLGVFQLPGEPFRLRITPGFGDELPKQFPRGSCLAFRPAFCLAPCSAFRLALLEPVLQRLGECVHDRLRILNAGRLVHPCQRSGLIGVQPAEPCPDS